MAEQRTEEQILGAFMKGSPGLSEEANPAESAQQPKGTEVVPVESQQAPKEEAPKEEIQAQQQEAEDAQTIEIDPEEPLFEQEIEDDGKKTTQKLSLKELQLGYLRQKDYTRKTQDLAKQRDELPQTIAKQTQELSDSYGKRLSELQNLVLKTAAADLQGVDWNKLATEDAFEYVRLSNRANQVKELLQTIQTENESLIKRNAEQEQQKKVQAWSKSLEILNRDIPNFGPDVVKTLIKTGEDWGFDQAEISQWADHRLIKMLHALSDKKATDTKKPEVEKKVALVTKILKPGSQTPQRSAVDEARRNLRKTGKAEDALPIFESFIR